MRSHAQDSGRRFDEALREAARFAGSLGRSPARRAHAHDAAALVVETEGDVDCAVAAMMHDVCADAIDDSAVDAIGDRFGERVARIVAWCGAYGTHPLPAFRGLDEVRVAELLCAPRDVVIVAAADTLSAVRTLHADLLRAPVDAVSSTGTADSMRWFFSEVDVALRDRLRGHVLTRRVSRAVEAIEPLLGRAGLTLAG